MDKLEFNPEIELDRGEQAALASIVSQPGFKVLQKIGKACVDQFVVKWINQDKPDDVVIAHHRAKVAAQFYTQLIAKIQNEVQFYIDSRDTGKPIEIVQGIDLGESASIDDLNSSEEELL